MNQELLKKQLKGLIVFFEKQPKRTLALSVREHQSLLKGVLFILGKCPVSIDFTNFIAHTKNSRAELIKEIENKMIRLKMPESIDYNDISEVLKLFYFCLSIEFEYKISTEEWIELEGSLRALELERLWVNVKK